MPVAGTIPLELVPASSIPPPDAFKDRNFGNYSDIFPWRCPEDLQGMLGNYRGGEPDAASPLGAVMAGVRAYRYQLYQQEEDSGGQRTEETRRGLYATMLQTHLISYVHTGHHNLLVAGWAPEEAIGVVQAYIDTKKQNCDRLYNNWLDEAVVDLADLDRGGDLPKPREVDGIPVIYARDMIVALGEVPSSIEVEREEDKQAAQEQIGDIKFRLQRLEFEWLSATAIVGFLDQEMEGHTTYPPSALLQ